MKGLEEIIKFYDTLPTTDHELHSLDCHPIISGTCICHDTCTLSENIQIICMSFKKQSDCKGIPSGFDCFAANRHIF